MPEDLRLELAQLRAGLDPELVDEAGARILVHVQCLGLPACTIQREHQLLQEASRAADGRDERLELADDVAVASELEIGVDPLLERDEP